MIYQLAQLLLPYASELNVLTYHTVRAGGAAITAFLLCLIFGPDIIHRLREMKIGQFIKKDHVADLHELHKGKAGTPTMGGTIMLISTLLALLLWSTLTNRLLWIALFVFLALGIVGFIDDYIKLKRKHNDGLSAGAKFTGQITTGLVLGLYLVWDPITVSASYIQDRDVVSWPGLVSALVEHETPKTQRVWDSIPTEQRATLLALPAGGNGAAHVAVLDALRTAAEEQSLYDEAVWPRESLRPEALDLLNGGVDQISKRDLARFNRLLIEDTFAGFVADSVPNLHTKLGVPGFKELFIPLGLLYVVFVVLVIVSVSNAVNLTDGLDGLAAGTSIISIFTYAAIAYVVSRADWSYYLYLIHVPEASELFVFGGALLGAGLGFLWFNSHPAEVFMGDTGSLALGGAIASMALLTKQELLLPFVCGLFALEAGSVVIQVLYYKATKKRFFRMAPLHHHFELLGWAETKVTMRFWIIAFIFALMSLGTLKLR